MDKSKPQSSIRGLTLQGLSQADRDLMLAMMAALGSAAQLLLTTSQSLTAVAKTSTPEHQQGWIDAADTLDAEVNSIIDLIKSAKARLKPDAILRVH